MFKVYAKAPWAERACFSGFSVAALILIGAPALAQDAAEEPLAEVAITASRVAVEYGFSAPTPAAVLDQAALQSSAPTTITDALSQIPQFATASQPQTGQSFANLRSLGASRTLTLVDGRRHVATFNDGTVDLNVIPTMLVSRTEIVTGGASASWGSDAVAGVVNLILDTKLEGFRGNFQVGQSKYHDAENALAAFGMGTSFAGGRGHVIVGGEASRERGIQSLQPPYASRPWAGRGSVGNTNFAGVTGVGAGQPATIYSADVRRADLSPGGLITFARNPALRNLDFLPNGTTRAFPFGVQYGAFMIGGGENRYESNAPGGHLVYPVERYSALTHASFDLTDSLEVFGEFSYAHSISEGDAAAPRNNGARTAAAGSNQTPCRVEGGVARSGYTGSVLANIGITADNAFLPAAITAQMLPTDCLSFGRTFREELGNYGTQDGAPKILRTVVGLNQRFGENWSWSAYIERGDSEFSQRRKNNIHSVRFNNAVDAVRDPNTGQIVCRVNIDAVTTNNDSRCVPFNLIGQGNISKAAIAYVSGTSSLDIDMSQTVAAAQLNGEPFSTWAGPVGMAVGAEYRKDELEAIADADSQADLWQTTNRKSSAGEITVKEGFAELVLPLLADKTLFKRVDLQLAARYTNYSSSGGVTTWKAGASWELNDQVRLRATKSRDIRAGNIAELFTPRAQTVNFTLRDRNTGALLTALPVTTTGNPSLSPEKADTFTAGIVYEPSWFEGFRASVDYYNIDVKGAIAALADQDIVDECQLRSNPVFCAAIDLGPTGLPIAIRKQFQNLDSTTNSGIDLELQYSTRLDRLFESLPGRLTLRALATNLREQSTTFFITGLTNDDAGEFNNPDWKAFLFATYALEKFSVSLDYRWFSGGPIDNTRNFDTTAPFNASSTSIDDLGAYNVTNMTVTYAPFGDRQRFEVFGRVNNVFNKWPPFPLNGGAGGVDEVGRAYRIGARFKF